MNQYKYQIKEEVRGDGKSVFLPMYAEKDSEAFFAVDDYGRWLTDYDEAETVINEHKERILHLIVVETKIHKIE